MNALLDRVAYYGTFIGECATEPRGATSKRLGLAVAAPFLRLAYVIAFPFVALAMLAWLGVRAVATR